MPSGKTPTPGRRCGAVPWPHPWRRREDHRHYYWRRASKDPPGNSTLAPRRREILATKGGYRCNIRLGERGCKQGMRECIHSIFTILVGLKL